MSVPSPKPGCANAASPSPARQAAERGARDLPVICLGPDRASSRAGVLVSAPGALAHEYAEAGGKAAFYGKPHMTLMAAPGRALNACKILIFDGTPGAFF